MDQNREAQVVDETRHGRTVWDFLSGMQRRQTFLAVAVLAAAALILGALLVIVLSAEPGSQIEIVGVRFTLRRPTPADVPGSPALQTTTLQALPQKSEPQTTTLVDSPDAFNLQSCMSALRGAEANTAPAASNDAMGIATGPANGTYHRFGMDLLALPHADRLIKVVPTVGTPQSVQFIQSPAINAGIGIIQADLFDNELHTGNAPNPLRKVMSLYREEVHILAQSSIKRLVDLGGKRVNLGPAQSGTQYTAAAMLRATKVVPSQQFNKPIDTAICDVLAGRLDATFYVAGKPIPVFNDLGSFLSTHPALKARVHFVEVNRVSDRLGHLEEAMIEPADYPWIAAPTKTVATRALLVAYDFSKSSPYYQKRCRQIHDLGRLIQTHHAALQTDPRFHSKWKDANFDSLQLPMMSGGLCKF